MRFERKDITYPVNVETLEIVRFTKGLEGYGVQVLDEDGDLEGIYDLDGEQITFGGIEFEVASDVPAEVKEAVEDGWATGNNVVTEVQA